MRGARGAIQEGKEKKGGQGLGNAQDRIPCDELRMKKKRRGGKLKKDVTSHPHPSSI